MSNNDLKTKLEDHIGYVSINRPPNNHFDAELIGQIADFLEEMDNERECRSIILSSEGKHFCAGADFTRSSYKEESDPYERLYQEAVGFLKLKNLS